MGGPISYSISIYRLIFIILLHISFPPQRLGVRGGLGGLPPRAHRPEVSCEAVIEHPRNLLLSFTNRILTHSSLPHVLISTVVIFR